MLSIYKKEMKTYFTSMTGYIFLVGLLLVTALNFVMYNIFYMYADYSLIFSSSLMTMILLIMVPILTMRLFAEESRQKTDQLLYTSPITVVQIVVGKFLAAFTLYLLGMVLTMLFPLILSRYGELPMSRIIGGYIGYILLGVSFISVGIFISAKTDNQIVAAAASFGVLVLLLMMNTIASAMPATRSASVVGLIIIGIAVAYFIYSRTKSILVSVVFLLIYAAICTGAYFYDETLYDGVLTKILNWFSPVGRYSNFISGILKVSDIAYYITFSFAFVYLTANAIEKRRWN